MRCETYDVVGTCPPGFDLTPFDVDGRTVAWTTMLQCHHPAARWIWAAAGHAHRALAPRCLARAAAVLAAEQRT